MSTGSWYWEITSTGGTTTAGMIYFAGGAWDDTYVSTLTTTITSGVTKGFRFNAGAGTFDWTTNGSSWTSIATGLTSPPYFIHVTPASGSVTSSLNCGQRAFAYAVPATYSALNSQNLPTPAIPKGNTYFDVVLYTGTGSSLSPTSTLGFSPDLVVMKSRSATTSWGWYDTVRGVQKDFASDSTAAETTQSTGLTAFNANGFTIGTLAKLNTSAKTYAAYCWKKSVTAGFDIQTYTGTGANRTISHALGAAPNMVLVKDRSGTGAMVMYHSSLTSAVYYVNMQTKSAPTSAATMWNSTAPTSSVFSLGTNALVNTNAATYVAYLWTAIPGFSAYGYYNGNISSDGCYIPCGFRPRMVFICADISLGGTEFIFDSAREPYNQMATFLDVSSTAADYVDVSAIEFLTNGFKIVEGSVGYINTNGDNVAWFAWAENPFKYALAR